MSYSKYAVRVLMAATFCAVAAAAGSAADLYGGPGPGPGYGGRGSIKDYDAMPPPPPPSRIYLRADGGFVALTGSKGVDLVTSPGTVWSKTDYGKAGSYGGGIGIYLRPGLRVDFTYDHGTETDITAKYAAIKTGRFGLSHDVMLANAYLDMPLRSDRFLPYIGFGIGVASNTISSGTIASSPCCASPTTTYDSNSGWNLAGAAMAGLTTRLSERVYLDTNYRYLYLGSAQSGAIKQGATVVSPGIAFDRVDAHEFRVGLRFDLR